MRALAGGEYDGNDMSTSRQIAEWRIEASNEADEAKIQIHNDSADCGRAAALGLTGPLGPNEMRKNKFEFFSLCGWTLLSIEKKQIETSEHSGVKFNVFYLFFRGWNFFLFVDVFYLLSVQCDSFTTFYKALYVDLKWA